MPVARNYNGGSIVYFQDDAADEIYVLQKGRVVLLSTAQDTEEELKEEVQLGEFFGVKSSLGRYPREETAQVIGKTWAHPADATSHIVVRSDRELACWRLQ